MVEHVVFLERGAIEATVRRPSFAHTWAEHDRVAAAEVAALLGGATIAIINKAPLPGAILPRLDRLRLVAVSATGTDNIDVAACRARGIVVSNIRNYAAHTLPDHPAPAAGSPDAKPDRRAGAREHETGRAAHQHRARRAGRRARSGRCSAQGVDRRGGLRRPLGRAAARGQSAARARYTQSDRHAARGVVEPRGDAGARRSAHRQRGGVRARRATERGRPVTRRWMRLAATTSR